MYLIVGASGKLGGATARRLLAQGQKVRVATRHPHKVEALRALGAEVVQADLLKPVSMGRACQGIDTVLTAAHALLGKWDNPSELVDDQGHRDLITHARMAGVDHFVYTSALGARPDHPVPFFRAKYKVEQQLQKSGMSYTILRPSAFMEDHAHNFLGLSLVKSGKVTLMGRGIVRRNFVAVDDVAEYALIAMTDPAAQDQVIEIGSRNNYSNLEVARLYAHLLRIRPHINHLPRPMLRVLSVVLGLVDPGKGRILHMMWALDDMDQSFNPEQTLIRYPVNPIGLEEWVRRKLAAEAAVSEGQAIQAGILSGQD